MKKIVLNLLICACLLLAVAAAIPAARLDGVAQAKQPDAGRGRCADKKNYKHQEGIGPACRREDGNWEVLLNDGTTLITHGPDGAWVADAAPDVSPLAALSSPSCVTDLVNGYYGMLIYAYASDRPDQFATRLPTIQSWFQGAQDKLFQEFQEFGYTGAYKMACNPDGSLIVRNVKLATVFNSTTFSTVQSDLRAQGYNNTHAKYWIYFDGRPPSASYCGIAGLRSDDRPLATNSNNVGPSYGMSVACNAFMHENGHNLGAVQNSAPNTSGAGHCNDDRDVMCYNDGGPNSGGFNPGVCTDREHWDCNHNDYFHPNPPAGNYLATHWNIGACYVRFIERSGCDGVPTPTATRTNTAPVASPTRTRTNTAPVVSPTPTATRTNTAPVASPTRTNTSIGPSPTPATRTIFSDNFETDQGWVVNAGGSDTATTGRWERADPAEVSYNGAKQLGTTADGSFDLVTGPLAGASAGDHDVDGGATSIRSPAITLSGSSSYRLSLRYYLAHASNSSAEDYLRVRIIGTTTSTVLQELGAADDDDAAWATATIDLSSFAGQSIRIEIVAADAGAGSLVEAAVDSVLVTGQ